MIKKVSIPLVLCVLILALSCSRPVLVPSPRADNASGGSGEEPDIQWLAEDDEASGGEELPGSKKSHDAQAADGKKSDIKDGKKADDSGEDNESRWEDAGVAGRTVRTRDVDFARAFEEFPSPRDPVAAPAPLPSASSLRYPPLGARKRPVRIMVRRNVKEATIHAPAASDVRAPGVRTTFRGRMQIEADLIGQDAVIATVNREKKELRLPCTLFVSSGSHPLDVNGSAYRGAMVIVSESRGAFSFINILPVEEYLRGVVPLEIGNLPESDIEAVKAQAIAARTYSYGKMAANENNPFDMLSTVSDQVYGGVTAEAATADAAILLTKDLIIAYNDDMVRAYYHSTCGGSTANIEDVWGGAPVPYLRTQSDMNAQGKPFCSGAGQSFAWTETWAENQLSGILRRYSSEGGLDPPFKGGIKKIDIRERFECGRVKTLAITSTSGQEHTAGGDKLRFVLRRYTQTRQIQILRSSNIRSVEIKNNEIKITGNGHGHGIGMCQVGAIWRARSGQNFEQILRTYYSGALIRTAKPDR